MNIYQNSKKMTVEVRTPDITRGHELPPLVDMDSSLHAHFEAFIKLYEEKCDSEKLARFRTFTEQYLATRYHRGNELDAPELEEARELKQAFHGEGNYFFLVTCIDGRNMPTVMFTFIPHSNGGFIRTQAGDLQAFRVLQNSELTSLDTNSEFYKILVKLLQEYPDGTIYYGVDSHVGCAARGAISAAEGGTSKDGGLIDDVKRKKKIAIELERIVAGLKEQGMEVANLIPDPFSYDPHQGTMIMGLKKYVDEAGPDGFTVEYRAQLATEGKIIDTWDLLHDAAVVEELERHVTHTADFKHDYPQSVLDNWKAITAVYDNGNGYIYKLLMGKLHAIYDGNGRSEAELEHKAKLLIKNLVTRWSIDRNDDDWDYDTHNERMIAITERAYGPYDAIDQFMVSSFEGEESVKANLVTANNLIRRFRAEGGIPDKPDDVLLIDNQSIIKEFIPGNTPAEEQEVWARIESISYDLFSTIDWDSDEVRNWTVRNLEEKWLATLEKHYHEVSIDAFVSSKIFSAIVELYTRMRSIVYDPQFASHLHQTRTIIMNTICDANGRPRIIVPLIPHIPAE